MTASRGRSYSRMSAAACARRPRALRGREALDDARQRVRRRAPRTIHSNSRACSSVRAARVARALAPGWARRSRSRWAHALALAVLDRLVGERVRGLAAYHAPTPRRSERPQPRNPRRSGRTRTGACPCGTPAAARRAQPARRVLGRRGRHREREDGRVVLGRATVRGDRDDLARPRGHRRARCTPEAVRVLARQRPLVRVERPALGAEDQEATEAGPVIDGPRVAAGACSAPGSCRESARSAAYGAARTSSDRTCGGPPSFLLGFGECVEHRGRGVGAGVQHPALAKVRDVLGPRLRCGLLER